MHAYRKTMKVIRRWEWGQILLTYVIKCVPSFPTYLYIKPTDSNSITPRVDEIPNISPSIQLI